MVNLVWENINVTEWDKPQEQNKAYSHTRHFIISNLIQFLKKKKKLSVQKNMNVTKYIPH